MNMGESLVPFGEPTEEQSKGRPQDNLDLKGCDAEMPHQAHRKAGGNLVDLRKEMEEYGDDGHKEASG